MADPATWSDPEYLKIVARYYAGIDWIRAHDPSGGFFFMYSSGIRAHHPMPAKDAEKRAEFIEWIKAYETWLKLDQKLLHLERMEAIA